MCRIEARLRMYGLTEHLNVNFKGMTLKIAYKNIKDLKFKDNTVEFENGDCVIKFFNENKEFIKKFYNDLKEKLDKLNNL